MSIAWANINLYKFIYKYTMSGPFSNNGDLGGKVTSKSNENSFWKWIFEWKRNSSLLFAISLLLPQKYTAFAKGELCSHTKVQQNKKVIKQNYQKYHKIDLFFLSIKKGSPNRLSNSSMFELQTGIGPVQSVSKICLHTSRIIKRRMNF